MHKLFLHRCVFWRRVTSLCKYLNADKTHVLWWVIILSYICFKLLTGPKYDILPTLWQNKRLFTIFNGNAFYLTLLPHWDTIPEAQIQSGAFENAEYASMNRIFQATILLCLIWGRFIRMHLVKNQIRRRQRWLSNVYWYGNARPNKYLFHSICIPFYFNFPAFFFTSLSPLRKYST